MVERGRSGGEYYQRRERRGELPPYHHSARFSGEQPAGQAYEAVQAAIYTAPPNEVSVYRLIFQERWHVTALGLPPPDELRAKLATILSAGEPVELPWELLHALADRRRRSIRQGTWVERHYRSR
jgi:hypothetical protein